MTGRSQYVGEAHVGSVSGVRPRPEGECYGASPLRFLYHICSANALAVRFGLENATVDDHFPVANPTLSRVPNRVKYLERTGSVYNVSSLNYFRALTIPSTWPTLHCSPVVPP